jgi:phosphoribosylamine--glycine ligase
VRIIVIGNGGREHALAWKISESKEVQNIYCIPGNGGTASLDRCENIPIAADDFLAIANFAKDNRVELVIVGPELPLSLGIADYLRNEGIAVFGPGQEGAQIEASKSWAKELMTAAGVPTAQSGTFTDLASAKEYINSQGAPIVVKADGLAAGKGVIVASSLEDALRGVDDLFDEGFTKVVVEEFLVGEEVSLLVITDGISFRVLPPAQDHKRIGEGDTGKNTGGMGVYAPAPVATQEILQRVETEVIIPVLNLLRQRSIDYRGILYAGLMITPAGEPKVLEFNCRFGDPETQAVLPLIDSSLYELLLACSQGRLSQAPPLEIKPAASVCVVAASGGYPDAYEKGKVITGIKEAEDSGVTVFHAGTLRKTGQLLTDGGRVLGVTGIGPDFSGAIERVYNAIDRIHFPGIYYRRDIGHRVKA